MPSKRVGSGRQRQGDATPCSASRASARARCWTRATRAAAAGLPVLRARAAEQERDIPFALAVEALDDAVAALHPSRQAALDPDAWPTWRPWWPTWRATPASRARAQRRDERSARTARCGALEELGHDRAVALLLDDLHWADQASLE